MLENFQTEKMRREELEILQLERLKKIVAWAYEKSFFYQKSFLRHGVAPENIQSLADIDKLPFLTREEIRKTDAFEFLTLPLSSIVRVSELDGIKKFYTRGDIQNNVEMLIRSFMAAGILRGSIVGLEGDLSDSRCLDALYALESIGATVSLTKNFSVDTIIRIAEDNLTCKNFKLFAPPEIGACLFCQDDFGCRIREENFLAEVSNGELVITTLTAQAMPLIRYRTGLQKKIIE